MPTKFFDIRRAERLYQSASDSYLVLSESVYEYENTEAGREVFKIREKYRKQVEYYNHTRGIIAQVFHDEGVELDDVVKDKIEDKIASKVIVMLDMQ